jgi:hypothetical protein
MEKPVNPNYCATVVRVKNTFPLQKCDNLVGANIFGFQVILGKESDTLGVFFPAETQLSDQYCFENNLFRHADKNKDKDQKGYIEDNRRVRAIKFKGNLSSGFFMPLDSLEYTGINTLALNEGDEFDTINGMEICRKYVVPSKSSRPQEVADRGFVRADKKFMPEHISTENFFRNFDKIEPEAEVVVTQKLHGTSIRIAHTTVNRKKGIVEKIASFLGATIAETEYAYLYGSKKVIKDANNPNQNHYYESDIWTNEGKKLDGLLPKNYIVYGELIGWTPEGKEIQKDYTYGLTIGQCELYVYRVAIVNPQGVTTDLSWDQVKEFCRTIGVKHVPELFRCKISELTANEFQFAKNCLDTRFFDSMSIRQALYLGPNKDLVDEGVCVRADGLTPKILKAKSPKFLEHETTMLDNAEVDIESQ